MNQETLRLAFVDPCDATREALRQALMGIESLWLEAESSRYEFFWDVIEQTKPDVALVALDADAPKGLQLISQLATQFPHLAVLAASSKTDGPFILQTLRSGAREFITLPVALDELLAALQRVRGQLRSAGESSPITQASSTVIAVVGTRGGVGCTSIAVNLGCILAQQAGHQVALMDLDLALGDADVRLDLIPDYTLADVAANIDRLDMTFLRRSLSKHACGLSILPHPVQMEDIALIRDEHLQRVLGLLRASYTHVVLDLSKSFRPTDLLAMQLADIILLVVQLELTSLRNAVRMQMCLGNHEGLLDRLRVVVNRVGCEDDEISLKKAEETIGRPIFWQIPNDPRTMAASRNAGVPLIQHAPRSKVCQSLQDLARALFNNDKVAANGHERPRKGFSLFRRDSS
ncbi:MAG: pilus assembly protein CpaE [Gemmataceae bacterium]